MCKSTKVLMFARTELPNWDSELEARFLQVRSALSYFSQIDPVAIIIEHKSLFNRSYRDHYQA